MRYIALIIMLVGTLYGLPGPFVHDLIISDYGPRDPGSVGSKFHPGIDYSFGGIDGNGIKSVEGGEIQKLQYEWPDGNMITVKSGDNKWTYCHLRAYSSEIKCKYDKVILVDTGNINNTIQGYVIIFWHDEDRYLAKKVFSSISDRYVKYGQRYIKSAADTTKKILTSNQVAAGEIIGPVGSTGASSGPHLHLGLNGGEKNPLLLIDHDVDKPSINPAWLQPQKGKPVYRKKYYTIRFAIDNRANKDLDSMIVIIG